MTFTIEKPGQIPIFIIAWLLIVKERWHVLPIGRTAGALLMGVITVVAQTLGTEEAFHAIKYETLALLWGMMVLVEYLKDDTLFDMFIDKCFVNNKSLTPIKLMWLLSLSCGCMSALFTNDTMCIALTRTICYVCNQRGYHPGPFMVAIAMSANIGSAATLIGNPQNAIIASLSGIRFVTFLEFSSVAMIVCLIVNTFALTMWYSKDLHTSIDLLSSINANVLESGRYVNTTRTDEMQPLVAGRSRCDRHMPEDFTRDETISDVKGNTVCFVGPFHTETNAKAFRFVLILSILLTLAAFLADMNIGWTATAGGVGVMFLDALINHKTPDRIFARVNWELLVFFSGLFIVIQGLQHTKIPRQCLGMIERFIHVDNVQGICTFTAMIAVGCNIFNNVPLVLLVGLSTVYDEVNDVEKPFMSSIGDTDLAWILLAWVSTVAGNLTLMGSVANLIVAEEGKQYHELSFAYYSKFGLPVTLVTLYLGVGIICLLWYMT